MKSNILTRLLPPIAFLAASGIAAWQTLDFPEPPGGVPGPAVMPGFLASILALLAVAIVFTEFQKPKKPTLQVPDKPAQENNANEDLPAFPWGRWVLVLSTMVAYAAFMPQLGFLSATAIFLYLCLRLFGHRGGVHAWAFSLASAFILYAVFGMIMNVPLPQGVLG